MRNQRGWSLIEMVIVIGLIAIISGIASGPFLAWLRKSRVEEAAGALHETFKAAQTQAMKLGGVEVVRINNETTPIKKRIYVALNEAAGTYKVVQWRDANNDGVKDNDEFTELGIAGNLGKAKFGTLPAVNKTACGNKSDLEGVSTIVNFSNCPANVVILNGHDCLRFDDKGFLMENRLNAAVYMTNDIDSYAISLNPTGIITLCRWSGGEWVFVR